MDDLLNEFLAETVVGITDIFQLSSLGRGLYHPRPAGSKAAVA